MFNIYGMLFLALQKGQMTIIASPHFPLSKNIYFKVHIYYIYTTKYMWGKVFKNGPNKICG